MSLCVHGPYSHHTDFTLVSYCTAVSYFRLLISIILSDCVCKGHTAISQIFTLISCISELLLISIILCDCVCRGHTAIPQIFTLISYISKLFQTIDKYNSVRLCVQGPYSHPTDFHFNQLHQ